MSLAVRGTTLVTLTGTSDGPTQQNENKQSKSNPVKKNKTPMVGRVVLAVLVVAVAANPRR